MTKIQIKNQNISFGQQ